jgi:hypothetical protein
MEEQRHDYWRDGTCLLANQKSDAIPNHQYQYSEYLYCAPYKHRKARQRILGFRTPRHPLSSPRRPIFWSHHSRRSKRLYLLRKKEQMETVHAAGLHLYLFGHKAKAFDFVAQIAAGKTLLVGEGNLSFTLSLTRNARINPNRLTATIFEYLSELPPEAKENAKRLRNLGVSVLFNVDATKLSSVLGWMKFDSIVFQFPHAGSREPVEGHNPNFILVRDFLESASRNLTKGGKILISAVDTPHYRGAFQFDDAAKAAGFLPPESYPFDPGRFRGYHHTMTHQEGSALENHDEFATWVFRPKS